MEFDGILRSRGGRGLENRKTGEAYWDYVRRLAEVAGVDGQDAAAVRRFEKQRPASKTSNREWVNPNDPDAKVAQAKDGATDMLYKSENVVDLDTGAIIASEVRKADEADSEGLVHRVSAATTLVEAIRKESIASAQKRIPESTAALTAHKSCYRVAELEAVQQCRMTTVISDPLRNRRVDKLDVEQQIVVLGAKSSSSRLCENALLRRRGMHIECSFAYILDSGGIRRATLRGQNNLNQLYNIAAAAHSLSQLMRHLFGIGTPKQAAAASVYRRVELVLGLIRRLCDSLAAILRCGSSRHQISHSFSKPFPSPLAIGISGLFNMLQRRQLPI